MRNIIKLLTAAIVAVAVIGGVSIAPSHAESEAATRADIKRLDHEIEMLKLQVTQLQTTMNQHSKSPTAMEPSMMGKPGMGMQGQGMSKPPKGMPMTEDDAMEMPPMSDAPPQNGNMPSGGGMGDM